MNLDEIYKHLSKNKEDTESIPIGETDTIDYVSLLKEWIQVVDQMIGVLPDNKKELTKEQKELYKLRLFDYTEYKYLFIGEIAESRYPFLEPFSFLGISTKQRLAIVTYGLSYNTADYISLIDRVIPERLRKFFKNNRSVIASTKRSSLEQNTAFISGTGSGKSTLMVSTIEKLFHRRKDYSFVIIDPHGDLSIKLSKLKLDKSRIMFFSLKDFEKNKMIFSYNVFDIQEEDDLNLGISIEQIVDAISELPVDKGHQLSANMSSLLTQCLKFLFKNVHNPNLLKLHNLLSLDPSLLAQAQQTDKYFGKRFTVDERQSRLAARRRVENAIKNDVMTQILCGDSTFNLEKSINGNKMLIFDLSGLGNESQIALGKFLIANIKNYVRKRDPNNLKTHTYLIIDEAQNFLSKDYEDILSQRRKFGLHVMLACQYTNQLGANAETVKYNTAVKVISGENPKDFANLLSIPNAFLKKGYDNKVMNRIDLKDYEFLLNVRGKDMVKFKSPDYLVTSNLYERNEIDQNKFEQDQFKKFYKVYNEAKKSSVSIPKNELAPLNATGGIFSLPDIVKTEIIKDKALLYSLSKYKFLTIEQMMELQLSNFSTGLPTAKLEKDGFIKSVRVQPEGGEKTIKVFFLTKKGAKYVSLDSADEIKVNYPTSKITKIAQIEHKLGVIDHAIQLSRYDLKFLDMDIHNSGIRNQKSTCLKYSDKKIEPDMLFAIKTPLCVEYYTFEYERLVDSNKSFKKVMDSYALMESQAYQRSYDFKQEYRSLFVFEEFATMSSVMNQCKESRMPIEKFSFKLADQPINIWQDYAGNKKELFYI